VCLLCDRDIPRNGVEVEFFGERTTMPAGPVTIAMRTGAPILPTAVYFTDRNNGHLGVGPPADPAPTQDGGPARRRRTSAPRTWPTSWRC
jgi:phosphatidylinositol dimannoside acyltransferase